MNESTNTTFKNDRKYIFNLDTINEECKNKNLIKTFNDTNLLKQKRI